MNKLFTLLLAAVAVCGCRNAREIVEDTAARETVEEVAANTDVSYETSESECEIIRATNDFSFKLFQSVAANSQGKDILISPLGVVYSLDLISNGAGGHTKQLLKQQLGTSKFNQDDINALRRKMMLCHAKVSLDDVYHTTKSAFLKSSNLLLYRDGLMIKQDFVKTIAHGYFADCIPFTQKSEVKKILDTWNKESNRDALKDVSIDIDENTRACLVNTLLFNASWAQMFNKTKNDIFYKTPKEVRTVDMMCNTEKEHYYKYMQNSQYQMLRLPYVGAFYMDVILPNKNITIDHLLSRLDLKQYEESTLKLNTYDIVEVGLPKFYVKSELNLLKLLSDIGLSDLFSMNADYSFMSDSSLNINRMRQDIEMEIDEKGTHIEAVTSTCFATKGETRNPTKAVFYANRPFIYFIRDCFGTICFAGIYTGWSSIGYIHYPGVDVAYNNNYEKMDM